MNTVRKSDGFDVYVNNVHIDCEDILSYNNALYFFTNFEDPRSPYSDPPKFDKFGYGDRSCWVAIVALKDIESFEMGFRDGGDFQRGYLWHKPQLYWDEKVGDYVAK